MYFYYYVVEQLSWQDLGMEWIMDPHKSRDLNPRHSVKSEAQQYPRTNFQDHELQSTSQIIIENVCQTLILR